jgi:predicted ATPase
MITKIEVDGFKSLTGFELVLNQGLNILVGPNGAGKTNIIQFFEFLSNIISSQIGNAISNVGGAGVIFRKIGKNDFSDTISCKIYGSCFTETSKKYYSYEYNFEIKISFEKDNVFYSNQEIKLRNESKFIENPSDLKNDQKWDLRIQFIENNNNPVVNIKNFEKKKFGSHFVSRDLKDSKIKEIILTQDPTHHALIRCAFPLADDILFLIISDLRGGETFNIIPSRVRELEDSATPPGIKKDGSGLATTLYAMKKSSSNKEELSPRFWFHFEEPRRTFKTQTLDKIKSYLKMANTTISSLDVENDPFSNKLIVRITIQTGDYEAVLPLSSMSDGTIKWLTLITAILTSKTIFSIEEPENFLHPWMQAEIAAIMRNHLEEKKTNAFVLMSTHSESLLNHAKPEEIIIVDLSEGKTKAKRINNLCIVKDEISKSGFGLGHFYFSDALEHE